MDEAKREAKINAYFSTIKQRKWNSSILIIGVAPRVADPMSGVYSATLDIPLAPPLWCAPAQPSGLVHLQSEETDR